MARVDKVIEDQAFPIEVHRLGDDGALHPHADHLVIEEPLEVQIQGASVAVLMRTPGHDHELVRGFLVTEAVIERPEDVARLVHCDEVPDDEAEENVMRVHLREGLRFDLAKVQRNLYATSSCGVCGKATIENLLTVTTPVDDDVRISAEVLYRLPAAMRAGQAVFEATGGLHAAGLFDKEGNLLVLREDVGRHNAVDKTVGWALAEGRMPLAGHVLMVSGRVSFEVVQKAAAARIPVVCAVSAPSSLAVRTAEALGITLVGFLRERRANVYSRKERVAG